MTKREWKDITKECRLEPRFTCGPEGYMYIRLYHKDLEIGTLMSFDNLREKKTKTPALINPIREGNYKLEKVNVSGCHSFKVFCREDKKQKVKK